MADRTSAANFSNIFKMLAKRYKKQIGQDTGMVKRAEILGVARDVWNISINSDFSPEQMGCDEELRVLDLLTDAGYADYDR
jgi:hypothetical protein